MSDNLKVLVVGAGLIAREYVKVLLALGYKPVVVGRGETKVKELQDCYPQINAEPGGLEKWLSFHNVPEYAIVATPIEALATSTRQLLQNGAKNILVEKPFTYSSFEANELSNLAVKMRASVQVAFNRRSYVSVQKAIELIHLDGGVSSFHFDFTEAIFRIDPVNYNAETNRYWGIANSSHVIDTAFYLCGKPKRMDSSQYGQSVAWHPAGSIFCGMGETEDGVPFTYHADWGSPGRWNIEIMTQNRKLIFSPMERLKQQIKNSFSIEEVDVDYKRDNDFKPGFYHQVEAFLNRIDLFPIDQIEDEIRILSEIFGYQDDSSGQGI